MKFRLILALLLFEFLNARIDARGRLVRDVILRGADGGFRVVAEKQSIVPNSQVQAAEADSVAPVAQLSHHTEFDRYPKVWAALKEHLASTTRPKLLSFGCSNGAEVRTLRSYMPSADVDGVDIDAKLVEDNVAKNTDPHIHFFHDLNHLPVKQYDAVTIMSVLERWNASHPMECSLNDSTLMLECSQPYRLPFATFDSILTMLDPLIAPGGYAVLYNGNYRFEDASIAKKYRKTGPSMQSGGAPKFSVDGSIISTVSSCNLVTSECDGNDYPWVFFQKLRQKP